MPTRFSPYPAYKPSNVPWLGDIPAHWEVKRLKNILSRNDGGVWGDEFDDDGTIVLRSTDMTVDGHWKIDNPARRLLTSSEVKSALLEAGDLLITKSSGSELHLGKTAIVTPDIESMQCCFSNFMQRLRLGESHSAQFFYRILNSQIGREQFNFWGSTTTGLANLNGNLIGNIYIPVPDADEQRAIAAFLDRETARLDALIAKNEQLIERLQEKRTALISRAVTKGLDANARMKDSGVEWLGEIPERWGARQFKQVAEISYGLTLELDRTETEGTFILSLPNVTKEGRLILDDVPKTQIADAEKKDLLLRKGDLLFNWRNGSPDHVGKTAYFDADGEYIHVSFLLRLRLDPNQFESRYFQMFLNNLRNTEFFSSAKTRVNKTYNQAELGRLMVTVPSLHEQRAIAEYLDRETARLDALVTKIQDGIARLREYRGALIAAAVTGKVDVRETA